MRRRARPGTAALRIPGTVSSEVARSRASELREISANKAAAYERRRHGGAADVIAIGSAGTSDREGLTGDYLTVRLHDSSVPRGARFQATLRRVAMGDGRWAMSDER